MLAMEAKSENSNNSARRAAQGLKLLRDRGGMALYHPAKFDQIRLTSLSARGRQRSNFGPHFRPQF